MVIDTDIADFVAGRVQGGCELRADRASKCRVEDVDNVSISPVNDDNELFVILFDSKGPFPNLHPGVRQRFYQRGVRMPFGWKYRNVGGIGPEKECFLAGRFNPAKDTDALVHGFVAIAYRTESHGFDAVTGRGLLDLRAFVH